MTAGGYRRVQTRVRRWLGAAPEGLDTAGLVAHYRSCLRRQWYTLRIWWAGFVAAWALATVSSLRGPDLIYRTAAGAALLLAWVALTSLAWRRPGRLDQHPRRAVAADALVAAALLGFGGGVDSPFLYVIGWPVALAGILMGLRPLFFTAFALGATLPLWALFYEWTGDDPRFAQVDVRAQVVQAEVGLVLVALVLAAIVHSVDRLERLAWIEGEIDTPGQREWRRATIQIDAKAADGVEVLSGRLKELEARAWSLLRMEPLRDDGGTAEVVERLLRKRPEAFEIRPLGASETLETVAARMQVAFTRMAADEATVVPHLEITFETPGYDPDSAKDLPLTPRQADALHSFAETALRDMLRHGAPPYAITLRAMLDPGSDIAGDRYELLFHNSKGAPRARRRAARGGAGGLLMESIAEELRGECRRQTTETGHEVALCFPRTDAATP